MTARPSQGDPGAASSMTARPSQDAEWPGETSEDACAAPSSVTSQDGPETWQSQRRKRVEIIRQMKETEMYRAFAAARPRCLRRESEPMTPDPKQVMSKQRWEDRFFWFKRSMRMWWEKNRALEDPTVVLSESQGSSDIIELD
mmetsp:Transcript_79760/g.110826  ORF Transcript_79760/g.110826 Transcript_79760/m.110826 type:complete len:143 (-) Transcript_79760:238-666(-)